jgi:hypothetical protein
MTGEGPQPVVVILFTATRSLFFKLTMPVKALS